MEFIEKRRINETKNVKHHVAPCIKCGGDDINLNEYEDRYGYISTAKCRNATCGNAIKQNVPIAEIIKYWNNENDIDAVLSNKEAAIARLKNEIKDIKILKRALAKRKVK